MRRLLTAAAIFLAAPAAAQTNGYISIGGGGQVGVNDFSQAVSFPFRLQTATFRTDYPVEASPILDVGGGVLFGRVGGGVHWTRGSQTNDATLFARLPDRLRFNNDASATGLHPVDRTESGVHIQITGSIPAGDNVTINVYGGPSYFSVTQDLVMDIGILEETGPLGLLPIHTLGIAGASVREICRYRRDLDQGEQRRNGRASSRCCWRQRHPDRRRYGGRGLRGDHRQWPVGWPVSIRERRHELDAA